MKPLNVGGVAKQNNPLNTYTSNVDGGGGKDGSSSEVCVQKGISWQGRNERKGLAELLVNERAIGPLLEYLKSTEVGGREGGKERKLEWERRNDQAGEELLGA